MVFLTGLSSFCSSTQITLQELEAIKKKPTQKIKTQGPLEAALLKATSAPSKKRLPDYSKQAQKKHTYQELFWWQLFPTTGIRIEKPFYPLTYPFLPHAFALWQLAPSLGRGITVALLDTGIAAYSFTKGTITYTKHPDLPAPRVDQCQSYNFIPQDPMAGIRDILAHSVMPNSKTSGQIADDAFALAHAYSIEKKADGSHSVNTVCSHCMHTASHKVCTDGSRSANTACSHEMRTGSITNYLIANGKKALLEQNKKQLSTEGQRCERMLVQELSALTLITLQEPFCAQPIFFECLPTIQLGSRFTTLGKLPVSCCSDHGTHIASMIGARLSQPVRMQCEQTVHTQCKSGRMQYKQQQPTLLNQQATFRSIIQKLPTRESIKELLTHDSGLCGIAPECTLEMFKTLHAYGLTTDLSCSTNALSEAISQKIPIVNISLKCNERWDSQDSVMKAFEEKLAQIPYACVSVGNDGKKIQNRIAYPARCSSVHFSVGAFGCFYDEKTDTYSCPLFEHNQSEKDMGPRYVDPGVDVLGCSFFAQTGKPCYALHSGTSFATGCMSGFLALLLGEFETHLSKKQILELCDSSCLRLHATREWKEKVLLGVIDMRTALFAAHVLVMLKKNIPKNLFDTHYSYFLKQILTILFEMPDKYGKENKVTCSFKDGFVDYYNQVHTKKPSRLLNEPWFFSLPLALQHVYNQVLATAHVLK